MVGDRQKCIISLVRFELAVIVGGNSLGITIHSAQEDNLEDPKPTLKEGKLLKVLVLGQNLFDLGFILNWMESVVTGTTFSSSNQSILQILDRTELKAFTSVMALVYFGLVWFLEGLIDDIFTGRKLVPLAL